MANIKEYTETADIRPVETGIEATAQAARRIGAFYNQVAQGQERTGAAIGGGVRDAGDAYVAYEDHKQINHGAAAFAKYGNDKIDQLNDTIKNADPNDDSVGKKFLAEMEPELQDFRNGFTTEKSQQWAEQHIDQFRQHMTEKVTADMGRLAGDAVAVNARQTVNSLSNTAYKDPTSLDYALGSLDSYVTASVSSSPNLKGTDAAGIRNQVLEKGRESVVKSAAMGYINASGGQMPPWLDDPKYGKYVNGTELQMFAKNAQVTARMMANEERQAENWQHTQNARAADEANNRNFADNVDIDKNGKITLKPGYFRGALDITKMPDAPTHLAPSMIQFGERIQNQKDEPNHTDPDTYKNFADRLFDPANPLTLPDLMKAHAQRQLSDRDFNNLHNSVKELEQTPLHGPIFQDTMAAAKARLTYTIPGVPGKDPNGSAAYASFAQDFLHQYLDAYRTGTLPPDALSLRNPDSMISKAMEPYKRSASELLRDRIEELGGLGTPGAASGGAPAPAPGGVSKPPLPTITTKEQFDKLPRGANFIDADGKAWVK
jgi:hypothetical protein